MLIVPFTTLIWVPLLLRMTEKPPNDGICGLDGLDPNTFTVMVNITVSSVLT